MKKSTDDEVVVDAETTPLPPKPVDTTTDALNKLIAALLPVLNQALVKAIVDGKCDPWKNVIVPPDGIVPLGQIEIPFVCTAKAEASYTVKDMKGLSSLVITSMTAQTVKDSVASKKVGPTIPTRKVTGTLSVTAKLSKNLTATVGGKVTASCGTVKESVGLSGKATAKTVTAMAKGDFTADIGYPKTCFTALTLKNFLLNYADIDVDVPGDYGIFDAALNLLWDEIDKAYGAEIKGDISAALQPLLNDLLVSLLPLCIDPATGKGT